MLPFTRPIEEHQPVVHVHPQNRDVITQGAVAGSGLRDFGYHLPPVLWVRGADGKLITNTASEASPVDGTPAAQVPKFTPYLTPYFTQDLRPA